MRGITDRSARHTTFYDWSVTDVKYEDELHSKDAKDAENAVQ
jgi:hypothetical protein